ncbi:Rqc2 family fibronectin-binding protein [Alkaliphilus serpentinus]|uniref:Rqc2 homolog RqcH n=1 Tax=Alkaliphilus serpentinus TaxID=1482731 RepID=A0A833HRF4_9FIRM|nr:NFACT RNA binding domain-containing protein [Alkaliphilus serpentinus]KAB3533149.1 fibronectin/fibrinogen-binding protein [Alkaliphilus serpentinus]
MALDGLVIAAMVEELQKLLPINKIEKVYQPEIDELLLHIRAQGRNYKLLLSADSSYPRTHFIDHSKENPAAPPNFCMLLRKHLQGGRIISITQPEMERMIIFNIENYDELNVLKSKKLIIEIMGKHSNIILVDSTSDKIIDSIKRVPIDVSRYRQVLPGLTYQMPPAGDKVNPLTVETFEEFSDRLLKDRKDKILKAIYGTFTGISPLISRELCFLSDIEENTPLLGVEEGKLRDLYHSFTSIIEKIKTKAFNPSIYIDDATDKYIDFNVLELQHLSIYRLETFEDVSGMLETFYRNRDIRERIKQKSQDLRKNLNIKLDRLYNKIENLQKDLERAQRAEEYKVKGDLITSNLHLIKGREERISVINYYDAEMPEVVIELDQKLSASQNAQSYYKQYNKYKTAVSEVHRQMDITTDEISYIEEILMNIEHSTHISDLEEIQRELSEAGIIKGKGGRKQKEQGKKPKFLRYLSSDGYEIIIGKNNQQNDEITFKLASKNDLWLHVKDIPGSHTILKVKEDGYSKVALFEAATLAAYYSKGRESTKVAVDYTPRKNVKKPSGAKAGMVIYDHYETVYVDGSLRDIKGVREIE